MSSEPAKTEIVSQPIAPPPDVRGTVILTPSLASGITSSEVNLVAITPTAVDSPSIDGAEIDGVIIVEDPPILTGRLQLPPPSNLPWYKDGNALRVLAMASLTLLFCLGEIGGGIAINSLAVLSDAFHMISDEIALVVGFAAMRVAKRPETRSMSYGFRRAEILGALVNGIFLLSVSIFIALDAIQRFIEPPVIKQPIVIIIIGAVGLLLNLVGLVVFGGHAHMGHDHGHAHSHGHSHGHSHSEAHEHEHADTDEKQKDVEEGHAGQDTGDKKQQKKQKKVNLNLHGIFLHMLGDALGSIAAMVVGLIIQFVKADWKYYMDPVASIIVSIIILNSGIPLVRRCIKILMQASPDAVNLDAVLGELHKVPGIRGVHDVHVWQLGNASHVGTMHVACDRDADFMELAPHLKAVLHKHNIHKTTIQPEFLLKADSSRKADPDCVFMCDFDTRADDRCSLLQRDEQKRLAEDKH